MSDVILNLDFTRGPGPRQRTGQSLKHRRFLQRRAYLERKGYLHRKQVKPVSSHNSVTPSGLGHRPQPKLITQPCLKTPTPGQKPTHPSERNLLLTECQSGLSPFQRNSGGNNKGSSSSSFSSSSTTSLSAPCPSSVTKPYKCVALDCEMVGTGQGGKKSELARCSVIGYDGDLVYDKYILPPNPITDYRTRWSGIRRQHMKNATPFKLAQKEILKVLYGKIVIGHAVHNDFKALNYFHPQSLTRDTSKIPLLNRKAGFPEKESVSLKKLTKQLLHRDIQVGKKGHSSVEDARATMELYKLVEAQLESEGATQTEEK
ncbi:interferon-stimulated 20 kDa exonuclease-like 2 [Mobula hypostoma]|uniref:interferon-stimulated 20 kDa exonuclease-like 2 n=1 Tax=Mobula hypostoma TaxID=723540 RepID=UPI002FC36F94